LKHYRPFRFTKDARFSCKITAILASLICAGCVVSTIASAQNTPPAPASNASIDDALRKGREAFLQKDYAQALSWFRKAADQGDAIAQFMVGDMYDDGIGVTPDYGQALSWYRKAADQGYAGAQNNLGVMYQRGHGVPQDYQQAMMWYRKAADQGDANAQSSVGDLYRDGLGVAQDYQQAMIWYRKAADQGVAGAETNLGIIYENGNGVRRDYQQAMIWLRKAADHGDAAGQNDLASMYLKGEGTPPDYGQAMIWFLKAADQGNSAAQFNLGFMYQYGRGVAQDTAQALIWYRKAADQGLTDAKAKLAQLNGHAASATTSHAADNADAQAAFQFLERQLTASTNFLQQPEPGLSRLEKRDGDICKLTCGYHTAVGLDTVVDGEFEFAVSDMAPSTLKWEMDPNFKRAFVSFSSAAGTPVFRARGRSQKVDMPSFRALSDWTKWNEWKPTEKVICRSNPDKGDLDRVLRAFSVLAKACGAHQTPF
jgi:TPR repeat protein